MALFDRERLFAAGYIACWKVVRFLPQPAAAWLFERAADYASDHGRGMEQLRKNLSRVVGPENVTRQLVQDSMRSYLRYWLEAFRLPAIHADPQLQQRLLAGLRGKEHSDASMASGRGVIFALPHSGNWDMAGTWLAENYGGFTTVAERLEPEALFDAFVKFRESLGFEVVPLTGGEQPPFERLKEVLLDGGIVCLLGERDFSRHGVPVTFFGEETTFPAGPAKLARDTGATLLVAHSWFTGTWRNPGWGFSISAPVEAATLEDTAQRVADQFAENIAAHPTDWHMLQPLWPSDRPQPSRRRELERRSREHPKRRR